MPIKYGKDGATFEPRPEQWKASYALFQRAQAEARTDAWLAGLSHYRVSSFLYQSFLLRALGHLC